MCGIVGFFDQSHNVTSETLHKMADSILHRGPDAEGFYYVKNTHGVVGLGHRRLSIIDVASHANQPIKYQNLIIVYNGEVYNYDEIKSELLTVGYNFDTNSDTEVILKAFHYWGVNCIKKFRGMFSFCIYDKDQQKAYLVRDRVGVKPLYYYTDKRVLMFASVVKAFRYHESFTNKLSENGLNLYFQYGYIPSPYSIFESTKKLTPGSYISYDFRSHTIEEVKYWDLAPYYQMPKLDIREHEAAQHLDSLLAESFKLRMISDVPVGVLLSGGIDSSLVAAILQSSAKKPIETFTMGFERPDYDESGYAREIANFLRTEHHERICTWKDTEKVIYQLPDIYDEPFADSSAVPTALISQFARKNVKVILSGDGGDELFCGYQSYQINEKRFKRLELEPVKSLSINLMKMMPEQIMLFYQWNPDLYNRCLKLKSVTQSKNLEEKYRSVIRVYSAAEIDRLLLNQSFYRKHYPVYQDLTMKERMMLVDFQHYLPDDILVKVDRATMFYSLEGREPLLDHTILEFAAQLPIHLKSEKKILKAILAKYLPPRYFNRSKRGFGVPVNTWLRKELRYLLDKYLDRVKIEKQGIFDYQFVSSLKNSLLKNNINDNKIWTLLMFQMWYESYYQESF